GAVRQPDPAVHAAGPHALHSPAKQRRAPSAGHNEYRRNEALHLPPGGDRREQSKRLARKVSVTGPTRAKATTLSADNADKRRSTSSLFHPRPSASSADRTEVK